MTQISRVFVKLFFVFLVFTCSFFSFQSVRAQVTPSLPNVSELGSFFNTAGNGLNTPLPVDDTLTATIVPENPTPNSNVFIDLADYSTDLNRANISWFLNGNKVLEGVGKKSFSTKVGDIGQKTTIKVVIITVEKRTLENTYTFTPSSLSIIAEVRGYTPPFYKGRALFANQGTLHLVALPDFISSDGTRVDPSTLIYKWKRNGQLLNDVSGYGKNVVDISEGVPLGSFEIDVEATTFDGSLTSNTTLVMIPQDPKIIFYEKDPLYGYLFNRAMTSPFSLTNNEISITAFPYFFSINRGNSSLTYEWSMNNSIVSSGTNDTMTFKNTNGDTGSSNISISITNVNRIFQMANANLTVNYSTK